MHPIGTRTATTVTVMAGLALIVCSCQRAQSPSGADGSAGSTALTHVVVIDGTGAGPKQDQTVVITGDRIAAVGPSADVKAPDGARLVDATGKYLIPGFWDLHVHLHFATSEVLPVFVATG